MIENNYKLHYRIIVKFLVTALIVIGIFIHELGHIIVQVIFGLPVCFSYTAGIGFSTAKGCIDIPSLPVFMGVPLLLGGLVATLVAYKFRFIREWFIGSEVKKLIGNRWHVYFDKYFHILRFLFFLVVCLISAQYDLAALTGFLL